MFDSTAFAPSFDGVTGLQVGNEATFTAPDGSHAVTGWYIVLDDGRVSWSIFDWEDLGSGIAADVAAAVTVMASIAKDNDVARVA